MTEYAGKVTSSDEVDAAYGVKYLFVDVSIILVILYSLFTQTPDSVKIRRHQRPRRDVPFSRFLFQFHHT